jgi:hypothetical protein
MATSAWFVDPRVARGCGRSGAWRIAPRAGEFGRRGRAAIGSAAWLVAAPGLALAGATGSALLAAAGGCSPAGAAGGRP